MFCVFVLLTVALVTEGVPIDCPEKSCIVSNLKLFLTNLVGQCKDEDLLNILKERDESRPVLIRNCEESTTEMYRTTTEFYNETTTDLYTTTGQDNDTTEIYEETTTDVIDTTTDVTDTTTDVIDTTTEPVETTTTTEGKYYIKSYVEKFTDTNEDETEETEENEIDESTNEEVIFELNEEACKRLKKYRKKHTPYCPHYYVPIYLLRKVPCNCKKH